MNKREEIAAARTMAWPSVNAKAAPLVKALIADADALRVDVTQGTLGECRIDCGVRAVGGLEAGRRIAEICLGGLGRVALETTDTDSSWPFMVTVHTSQPVLACLGSQYAGWSLSGEDNGKKYSVLGSGPARAIGSSEKLFEELDYRDKAESAVLVLEADRPPPPALVEQVAKACKLKPDRLTFIYAPTSSLAGTVQIAARCLEVALHKAHELHFPARPHRRRHRHRAAAAARARFHRRHGPHQRRHHLWRPRPALRVERREGGEDAWRKLCRASSRRITASRSPTSSPR